MAASYRTFPSLTIRKPSTSLFLNPSKSLGLPSTYSLLRPLHLSLRSTSHFPNSLVSLKTLNPGSSFTPPRTSSIPTDLSTSDIPNIDKSLKARLADGEILYGLFFLSFSPIVAEIAGLAGYDFVVVDMEHGHGGISDALPCLHALAAARTPAILRLPESSPTWAKKALDLGPQGIMFPMIENRKMAKKAVSYCRFPPDGVRGSAHTVVRASNYGIDEGYLSNYADELLIMCQVESEEAVKEVEEIAAVEGVDCIQMGPLDLSASLGYLWDPANKKVREVLQTAEKAVLETKARKGECAYLAGFAMPHDSPEELRSRGYHMVSGGVDVGMFRAAAVEDVRRFKMGLKKKGSDDSDGGEDRDEKYWSE